MDIARITSLGLFHIGRPGAAAAPAFPTVSATGAGTIDLTTGDGRGSLAGRSDPAALAWERSLVDLRRQATPAREDHGAAEPMAEPVLQRAVETLGVRGRLSQDEVDRRFREIVKAERPDLGSMSGERLDAVRAARSALTAHLQRARWLAVDASPPPGTVADLTA